MADPDRLDHRRIFDGKVFDVDRDTVRMPNGREVAVDIIRHPPSAVIVPVPEPGHVILIRQYRYALDRYIWEFPAGSLKPGEDPGLAAARECEEEIGLVPRRVERLSAFYPTPGFCDELMTFYRCTQLETPPADSAAKKDEDEDIETRAFTPDAIRAMIAAGQVIDLKTVAGLSLLK